MDPLQALLIANGAELVRLKKAVLLNGEFVDGYDQHTRKPTTKWRTDTSTDYLRLIEAIKAVAFDFAEAVQTKGSKP